MPRRPIAKDSIGLNAAKIITPRTGMKTVKLDNVMQMNANSLIPRDIIRRNVP